MATNRTLADIFTSAKAALNDTAGAFWTDAKLLPHANKSYAWMFNAIAKFVDVPFRKQVSLTYTANTDDLSSILPADFYLPEMLEFRKNTSEEWVPVNRLDKLPSRETQTHDRVVEWEFRLRTIFVNKSTENGLLRLRYLGLLSDLALSTDPILMDNVIHALGSRTAYHAYKARGQVNQAQLASDDANEFMGAVLDHLVLNDQLIQRRGLRFSQSGVAIRNRFTG